MEEVCFYAIIAVITWRRVLSASFWNIQFIPQHCSLSNVRFVQCLNDWFQASNFTAFKDLIICLLVRVEGKEGRNAAYSIKLIGDIKEYITLWGTTNCIIELILVSGDWYGCFKFNYIINHESKPKVDQHKGGWLSKVDIHPAFHFFCSFRFLAIQSSMKNCYIDNITVLIWTVWHKIIIVA